MTSTQLHAPASGGPAPKRKRGRPRRSDSPKHAATCTVLRLAKQTGDVLVKQMAAAEGVSRQTIWRWTRAASAAS